MHARADIGGSQQGFTYIGLLVAIVITGLLLTVAGRVWSMTERRNREAQLLFVGDQFRRAISEYFANGHQYPLSLELLLADDRSPVPKRYLRQLYADPMTGKADWELIRSTDGQGIMGVASHSQLKPIKQKGFSYADGFFEGSECYCAWQFVYAPQRYGTPGPVNNPTQPLGGGAPSPFLNPSPVLESPPTNLPRP